MANTAYHQRLRLRDFTVFQDTEFEVSPGINVLVGENGTGKTHLMKVLYACQLTYNRNLQSLRRNLEGVFQTKSLNELIRLPIGSYVTAVVSGESGGRPWQFSLISMKNSMTGEDTYSITEAPTPPNI